MKRFKLNDKYYKLIDGFEVNESSREVQYSNVKIDFTGKGILDLPLKYQECQLVDGDFRHIDADDGQRIEGTSFQVNQREEKLSELEYVKGQIEQTGTPTPTSPIPINITTGRQVVRVVGKNVYNKEDFVWIRNNDQNYQNQTNTNTTRIRTQTLLKLEGGTTYTISGIPSGITLNAIKFYSSPSATTQTSFVQTTTFTVPSNATYIIIQLAGTGFDDSTNILMKNADIMINKGTTALPYEEYKGIDYEINLGKNLYYMNYTDFSHTWNGLTITSTTTGYSISNTAEGSGDYTLVNRYITLPAGTYTMVLENASSMVVGLSKNNYASIIRMPIGSTSGTFTLSEETKVCLTLRVVNGTTYDETNNIMIEKGSVASSFSPYKTPIYLGKIGTYQDYIFRNTTENPLYDSNLEEGQWYIHKEIGRVVLNGSESWRRTGTKTSGNYYFFQDDILSNVKFDGSNRFIGMSNMGITTNAYQEIQGFDTIYHNNQYVRSRFYSDTTKTMSTSAFATWLSTHNTEVYYVLNTPTNTLIEDEELINQLNSIELLDGLNNVSVSSPYLSGIIGLHYNYQIEHDIEEVNEVIYTGYVNNYTLPKMKNKLEYRELDIDLLSPLALATLRTADAVGTYNLKDLIREIIQPLIDDGFTLKELNVGNNQISVNYLTETIESSLNKLSNKFNFWWYIDKNKNIYINDINYIFNKGSKMIYNDNNKINGLIDFTPKMESIDYCNTIDFTNVRLITKSSYIKDYEYSSTYSYFYSNYYYPIFNLDTINPGDEITFDIPFIINSSKKGNSQTMAENDSSYFKLQKLTIGTGGTKTYTTLVDLTYDENNQVILPNNVLIADSFNEDKEFVFVKDSFFDNLIVGMKYNGNSSFDVGKVYSETALLWTKIRINDNEEISTKKDLISKSGIIEKQVDMNEQWVLYEDLIDISNSLIRKDSVNVELVELKTDIENDFNVGDIIDINKPGFLTYGRFIITDKKRSYYDNVDSWIFNIRNTNILESYIDLFRATDKEEQSDRVYSLISSDYSVEGIKEGYEVEVL